MALGLLACLSDGPCVSVFVLLGGVLLIYTQTWADSVHRVLHLWEYLLSGKVSQEQQVHIDFIIFKDFQGRPMSQPV